MEKSQHFREIRNWLIPWEGNKTKPKVCMAKESKPAQKERPTSDSIGWGSSSNSQVGFFLLSCKELLKTKITKNIVQGKMV